MKLAINGFGRIGRQVLRALLQRHPDLEVLAINDLVDSKTNAHLFKYDTNYGAYPGTVRATAEALVIDDREYRVLSERNPAQLPWRALGVDLVLECSGVFTDAAKAAGHRDAGAQKVIISAPAKNDDLTIVLGVNEGMYDPAKHHILSNASCTTNCLAPVAKVLNDRWGIAGGFMTTAHAYTNDQRILDLAHSDLRRARAGALNIIPTTTGAAKAISRVIPDLEGKMHGIALRVPTATVSIIDLVVRTERAADADAVNAAFREAAGGALHGILAYTDEPLVSSDFKGDEHSAIVDGQLTMTLPGNLVKVLAWYDNEWGYACRLADLAALVSRAGDPSRAAAGAARA